MFHLGAFYQSVDPGGIFSAINAVREEMIFTNGQDFRVPTGLANIIGKAALIADASGVRAQIASPSLRIIANLDVEPVVLAATFGSPPEQIYHPDAPIPLVADEALNFFVQSNPAAAADHFGLVFLSDGAQQAVTGPFFTIRCTAAIQQVAGAWVNGTLAFGQTLPAGRYAVVGMRCRSTDGVAARLVFPEMVARPGVAVVNAIGDLDPWAVRFGRSGIFGEFPHTNPPTMDILGGVAAAQVVHLDIVRTQ